MENKLKFRSWDRLEKNFIYFTGIEGLFQHCDRKYYELNMEPPDLFFGIIEGDNGEEIPIYENDNVLVIEDTINGEIAHVGVLGYDENWHIWMIDFPQNGCSMDFRQFEEDFRLVGNMYEKD